MKEPVINIDDTLCHVDRLSEEDVVYINNSFSGYKKSSIRDENDKSTYK